MRRFLLSLPAASFVALVVLLCIQLLGGTQGQPSALIGQAVPLLPLVSLEHALRPLPQKTDFISTKPMHVGLINVWASWCTPCRYEHPQLQRLAHDDDLILVGINYKDTPSDAGVFLTQLGNPFTALGADPHGRASIALGITGVPETFLVDNTGTIRYHFAGPITKERMDTEVLPAVQTIRNQQSAKPQID